jgi:hypothetical protein
VDKGLELDVHPSAEGVHEAATDGEDGLGFPWDLVDFKGQVKVRVGVNSLFQAKEQELLLVGFSEVVAVVEDEQGDVISEFCNSKVDSCLDRLW